MNTLEQVREGEVPAELAGVYRDIRHCLRTTYVPLPFRVLAAHRGALRGIWEQLRPNVMTRAFEEYAGDLRASLARAAFDLGTRLIEPVFASEGIEADDLEAAREQIDLFHYTDPKVLLCLAALHAMESGGVSGRTLPAGMLAHVPEADPEMPSFVLPPEEPGGITGEVLHNVTRGLGLPVAEIELRTLGHWPEMLEIAWEQLAPILQHRALPEALTQVRQEAAQFAELFPFALNPARGLMAKTPETGAVVARVIETLAEPSLRLALFVSALKVAIDGPEDALGSQFQVEWDEPPIDQVELS